MTRTYNVFFDPSGKVAAVAEGFSFFGFFLTIIWLLDEGFIFGGIGLFVLSGACNLFAKFSGHWKPEYGAIAGFISIGIKLYVGTSGNLWLTERLQKRGFVLEKSVKAKSRDEAERTSAKFSEPVTTEWKRPF